jgi:uncharacterized membrane protein YfcA
MSSEHWYLLPVGFGIAALAMSSGISAGVFWVPVYLLWAKFEPPLAFWMTLATMLCGYGSGVVRNLRQRTIDRVVILRYLPFSLLGALAGGCLAPALNTSWLVLLFGVLALSYGVRMLVQTAGGKGVKAAVEPDPGKAEKRWPGSHLGEGALGFLGGVTLGLLTVGLGEILLSHLLNQHKPRSVAKAVGSIVLVIFVTSLAAAVMRLTGSLLAILSEQRATLLGALLFAGPGVILGGQLGPSLVRRLDLRALRWYVAILLVLVGLLVLLRFLALVAEAR